MEQHMVNIPPVNRPHRFLTTLRKQGTRRLIETLNTLKDRTQKRAERRKFLDRRKRSIRVNQERRRLKDRRNRGPSQSTKGQNINTTA